MEMIVNVVVVRKVYLNFCNWFWWVKKKIVDNFDFVRFFYLRYNLYELFNKNKKVNIL